MESEEEFKKIISGLLCPYCRIETLLVGGDVIYPHRISENPQPGFLSKKYYVCKNDTNHYVGTYSDNVTSLGRLADSELRKLKSEGHKIFDPLWKEKTVFKTQRKAYEWLSEVMNIPIEYTHFGMFTVEQCREAISILKKEYGEYINV